MTPCFVGLDLGTSGCRAIAIGPDREVLGRAAVSLPAGKRTETGHSEQDPLEWWRASREVLKRLTTSLHGCEPVAVSVDGTSATLLLVDGQGRPLSPALMYDDRRAVTQAGRLATLASPHTAVHSPTSSLAKLLWLLEQTDLAPGFRALHQAEWITARLSGRYDLGDENNSLKLGYDPLKRRWPGWMEKLGLPAGVLPLILPAGTLIGPIQTESAGITGLPEHCSVISGTTDSTAAALAAGIREPGEAVTSLGSTLVTKILTDRPLFSPEYGIYSHRIFDLWLTGGASNSGGRVLRQFFADGEIERLSRRMDPQRDLCLDYYPLPERGERFPLNDPQMEPRITPVPGDRRRFLQGLLEGIARIERLAYRRLEELGTPPPGMVFTAGRGAENETWRRMRQRLLKVPVRRARHLDAAYGAALIALRGWSGA